VETWSAGLAGTADYPARAIAARRTPLELATDGLRRCQAMTERPAAGMGIASQDPCAARR
jgi:hypothetical protein